MPQSQASPSFQHRSSCGAVFGLSVGAFTPAFDRHFDICSTRIQLLLGEELDGHWGEKLLLKEDAHVIRHAARTFHFPPRAWHVEVPEYSRTAYKWSQMTPVWIPDRSTKCQNMFKTLSVFYQEWLLIDPGAPPNCLTATCRSLNKVQQIIKECRYLSPPLPLSLDHPWIST